MATYLENILNEKLEQSIEQFKVERKLCRRSLQVESLVIVCFVGVFSLFVHFVFWGAGFSVFSQGQHDFSVALLLNLPGEQQALVEQDIVTKGHVSLIDYQRYVEMANYHKATNGLPGKQ